MRLPGAANAIVDRAKVRDYLLSPEHPVGRFKAAFFCALGYTRDGWERLQLDLLELGRSGTARPAQAVPFGQKYEVRGILHGPGGGAAYLVTIWIILEGQAVPRLVTAYPGETR